MTKNTATYLLTPPQRKAVTELAKAFAYWLSAVGDREAMTDAAPRLLNAQDALGIELIDRDTLLSHLNREAA